MPSAIIANTKDGAKAKDGHLQSDGIFGPKAFLDQWISKVKPKSYKPEGVVMEDAPAPAAPVVEPADQYVTKLISENPQMSAAAFLALMKSKGVQFSMMKAPPQKQADSSSSMVQMTREANKRLREAFTFKSARFLEAMGTNGKPDAAYTRFKTVLLAEGLGNLRDTYYYSKQALESAIPIFEGAKIYADHPSAIDEQVRPERSVRDILGHFENVHMEEGEDGQALLVGDVVIPPDEPFVWARSLMGHAVDFAKKYPAKDFVGLSINASGDATEMPIDQLVSQGVPQSALIKLQKAKELGNETVKIVSVIAEATSCDLVTEAGAGGKILQLLEGDMKMAEAKDKEMEKKEAVDQEEIPSSDDTMDVGHDDAAQDMELIKKMIAKYLSADEMANEEECGMVKQAYEACKEMGMDENEAAKHAVTQLRMAKHMASKQMQAVDVDAKKGVVGGSPEEDAAPMMQAEAEMEAHKESAVVTLTAKVAKLEQELKSYKTREHLDKILEASKLPKQATNKFRDLVKDAKTTTEIDKLFKVYEAAFKDSKPAVGKALNLDGVLIQAEKTATTTTKTEGGKALNLDGVFTA